jgi:O-antigen/teichoic acid export membrane protein
VGAKSDTASQRDPKYAADIAFVAKGGATLFFGRLFTWGIRFGVAVMLARVLGANGYGAYNLALSVATIGGIVPLLGLDTAIVRYTAILAGRGDWPAVRANLRYMLRLSIALSLVMTGALIVFSGPLAGALLHDRGLESLVLIAALMVPTLVLNIQLGSALRGVRRIVDEVLADQVFQPLVRLGLLLLLLFVGLTVSRALLAWTIASFATTVLLAYFVIRALRGHGTDDGQHMGLGELLRFSGPVFLSNVVSKSGQQLQTILLGALSTVSTVGVFAVATNLNLIGSLFHQSLVSASMPLFAAAQDRDSRPALERLYQITSRWSLTLNLPIFLVVVAYAQALLSMFGSEFRSGAMALGILAAANLVYSGTGMSGAVLDMTGHTRLKLVNAAVSVGLGIALNVTLVPSFGLVGAAVAALAVTAGGNILQFVEVQLLERASPYNRMFLKPITAGALALCASIGVKILVEGMGEFVQAAVGIPVLFITYATALIVLGVDADDRLVLRRVQGRFARRGRGGARQAAARSSKEAP